MMKKQLIQKSVSKKATSCCLVFTLTLSLLGAGGLINGSSVVCYAVPANAHAESGVPSAERKEIDAYLKQDITVNFKGEDIAFMDAAHKRVYPISYEGNIYLPLRGISSIMEKAIDWDYFSKTIFIGKTFSDPAGITKGATNAAVILSKNIISREAVTSQGGIISPALGTSSEAAISSGAVTSPGGVTSPEAVTSSEAITSPGILPPPAMLIKAAMRPDILVAYDFNYKIFHDENGNAIYPIMYENTAYLPVRSVSQLMKKEVVWDPVANKVLIGKAAIMGEQEKWKTSDSEIQQLEAIFQREKEIYNDVSRKIVELVKLKSFGEKDTVAKSISEDYKTAAKLQSNLEEIDKKNFTEEKLVTYNNLCEFTESMGLYILVIENVAYMAANDQDYSLLAENLLNYALESQEKMEKVIF